MKTVCKPDLYFGKKLSQADSLLEKKENQLVDAFSRQIRELFFIENPRFIGQPKSRVFQSVEFRSYRQAKKHDFGYVYYPWHATLVKCVDREAYFKLKTNRNQVLITREEQHLLARLKIGVFGMSVGSNIAFVLTQSGIANEITLADFDVLDTTNLNRIWAGVHQVGLNKTVIASRRIYEDNPFARVRVYSKGITEASLERLLQDKELDLIIEEIDDLMMKIKTRQLARRYKVPVIMITDNGDEVVLQVERYDQGWQKILGNKAPFWLKKMRACQGPGDFAQIVVNDIVGGPSKVDPKMLASVDLVLKRKLISWPQLGSAALLGGVVATVAVKKMIIGPGLSSGRYYLGLLKAEKEK